MDSVKRLNTTAECGSECVPVSSQKVLNLTNTLAQISQVSARLESVIAKLDSIDPERPVESDCGKSGVENLGITNLLIEGPGFVSEQLDIVHRRINEIEERLFHG